MLYGLAEAAKLASTSYGKLWFAVRIGELTETAKVGSIRLFDEEAVARIRRHFEEQNEKRNRRRLASVSRRCSDDK